MYHQRQISTAAGELFLAAGPEAGPPLLLLHGVLRRWTDFFPLLPYVSSRWEVQGLDFRGHGLSATAESYRVIDYVQDAVAAVERFREPGVIYGHSLGAMVALAAAATVPDRVSGVVLEDPPFQTMGTRIRGTPFFDLFLGILQVVTEGGDTPHLARRLAEIRINNPATGSSVRLSDVRDPASLRFSAQCLASLDPRVLEPIVAGRWLEDYDLPGLLPRIGCPVLLLQGDVPAGGMLMDEDAELIAGGTPECLRIPFPQVGHLIHWQATPQTVAVVGNFLESLR
ncbi:MAG: alpha/beta hydrolase [Pirellulaceae bacterium]|nr:alpha/beta hydrolase [Pirellulaceae bacterium]